eukprot:Pgem_evm1s339
MAVYPYIKTIEFSASTLVKSLTTEIYNGEIILRDAVPKILGNSASAITNGSV